MFSLIPLAQAMPATPPSQLLNELPELEPSISPLPFMEITPWWLYPSLIGGVLLLAGLAYYLYRRSRRKVEVVPESAQQRAHAQLAELTERIPELNLAAVSIELSLILRGFITGETSDPALYETHQEFNQRLDALDHIPRSCQEETHALLEKLAQMKYAGPQRSYGDETSMLMERTKRLIDWIAQQRAKEAEEQNNKRAAR